jgi:hypothetical protein
MSNFPDTLCGAPPGVASTLLPACLPSDCSVGTFENSPAIYRRVNSPSPLKSRRDGRNKQTKCQSSLLTLFRRVFLVLEFCQRVKVGNGAMARPVESSSILWAEKQLSERRKRDKGEMNLAQTSKDGVPRRQRRQPDTMIKICHYSALTPLL